MSFDYDHYLRAERLPHIFCPGCGHGINMKAIIRAIDNVGWNKDEVVVVSGIGCSSRIPGYLDFNTLHTTHGRPIPFATGVKLFNPKLKVIVISGDGDAIAIGGNHFIHACRRNIDMTYIVMNNYIYGMTGGQYSPTTPLGYWASTAPYGMLEPPFDISNVAIAAGASYVARTTAYHAVAMEKLITDALTHKGFSVVEVMSTCHTTFGRKNKMKTPVALLNWLKERSIPLVAASKKTKEELNGKIITGLLHKEERPEYTEIYDKLIEELKHDGR